MSIEGQAEPAPPATARKYYVVCSGPRTGSTHLCREMARREVFGQPGEFFNYFDTLFEYAEYVKPHNLPDYIDKLIAAYGAPGLFGWKTFWLDFRFVRELSMQFERFQPLSYIYLDRTDRAAQAVSFAYARASNSWTSENPAIDDLPYDRAAIDQAALDCYYNRQCWEEYFTAEGIKPLRLEYRDVVDDTLATLERVAAALAVTAPLIPNAAIAPLRRQSESAKGQWLARYREELAREGRTLA